MTIINRIQIGDSIYDIDSFSAEEKEEIGLQLNKQALEAVGYKLVEKPV